MKGNQFNITLDNMSGSMMLTIEPKEPVIVNEFCCEMIKKTNVFGLLKLNVTTIDGEIKFNYDLSKKKSIADFAKAGFNESYGKRILYNLCSAFLKLNEYYLKPSYCLLEPEYTYIGDGLNVYLPYIPIKDTKVDSNELKEYFAELLSSYFAVEGVTAYDEMFKYVYQCQTLDLNHFISKFLASEEQNQNNFIAEKQERQMNKMPLPNVNVGQPVVQPAQMQNIGMQNQQMQMNNNIPKQSNKPQGGFKMPGFGGAKVPSNNEMKMPGGGNFKMPGGGMPSGGNENQNAYVEKKGLFGFGKKPNVPLQKMQNAKLSMPNMNIPGQNIKSPIPNMNIPGQNVVPNSNMPNNAFQQQNNFSQMNKPQVNIPHFPNGFQGSMDKTIMIDGMNGGGQQVVNANKSQGGAYLQYRGQNIPINDVEFVIGKANNEYKLNFIINNNPHVSRKHATILMQGNSYFIRDEGSTNGTYVNGRSLPKMVPQPLQNGDEISIYDEVFRFCM